MRNIKFGMIIGLALLGALAFGAYGCGKSDGNGAGGKVIITGSGGT